MLKITTEDGENLQVTMKDGQTIPVQITTEEEVAKPEDEVNEQIKHLTLPQVVGIF